MHSRQLPAKAGNCGYAGRCVSLKKKKQDIYKLAKSVNNKNWFFNYGQ